MSTQDDARWDGLLARLNDLLVQATKERSHFYVAKCMADSIAAIRALRARAERVETLHASLMAEADKRLDTAEAEVVALREDAERYRWLKEPPHRWYISVMSDVQDRFPKFCVIGKDLDSAIDSVRLAEKDKGG